MSRHSSLFGSILAAALLLANPAFAANNTGILPGQPYVAPVAKTRAFYKDLTANSTTTILQANTSRLFYDLQCSGGSQVGVSRKGATLTSATPSSTNPVDLIAPTSATPPYFSPPIGNQDAITGYTTGTAQACWGLEYLQ